MFQHNNYLSAYTILFTGNIWITYPLRNNLDGKYQIYIVNKDWNINQLYTDKKDIKFSS